jgi:malate dehydrogenase
MKKVAVIGAGNVGATAVYHIAEQNIADVVMVDVVEGMPQSKALDYLHAAPLRGYGVDIIGSNEYSAIEGADVVVMTAGMPRKPGMDRMDLLKTNVEIAKAAGQAVAKYAPDSVVIAVANPLDIIAMVMLQETGFSSERVVGMAGVLDTARFTYFIADALNVWPGDVNALVLGGHGDTMVPIPEYTSVGGFPIAELFDADTIEKMIQRTRTGGGEIVNLIKTSSAFYAPGASAAKMVEAVVKDEKRLLPASAFLKGEYGFEGIFLGVPIFLGGKGVEQIVEIDLTEEQKAALKVSADHVVEGMKSLKEIYSPG